MHVPVLLDQLVDSVVTDTTGTYVDATFGGGGHSQAILERLDETGRLIVMDRDPEAIQEARALAKQDRRLIVQHGNFGALPTLLRPNDIDRLDGIVFDVGVSTQQLKQRERGFSFDVDGPLDMRMNPQVGKTASEFLNGAPAEEIISVLRDYGDVRQAPDITSAILSARPLTKTSELAELVKRFRHPNASQIRLVAQVFQAVRIQVNDELNELESGLHDGFNLLKVGGRIAVISFHSLEHRTARRFAQLQTQPNAPRQMPIRASDIAKARYVVKNLRPSGIERRSNPSARSAMMQVIERAI